MRLETCKTFDKETGNEFDDHVARLRGVQNKAPKKATTTASE